MTRSRPLAALVALLIGGAGSAQALDCPVPQPTTTASALQESPQTIRELSELMAAQGMGAAPEIIFRLRRRYPAAQDAEITNYLVAAYCPVVNRDAALDEAGKAARLGAFSSEVMRMLASP